MGLVKGEEVQMLYADGWHQSGRVGSKHGRNEKTTLAMVDQTWKGTG